MIQMASHLSETMKTSQQGNNTLNVPKENKLVIRNSQLAKKIH